MHSALSRSGACMGWTRIRWPWISQSCRCGWQHLPKITRLRSSITRCGTEIRWSVSHGNRSRHFIGAQPSSRASWKKRFASESIESANSGGRFSKLRDDTPYATLKQKLDGADESLVCRGWLAMQQLLHSFPDRANHSARDNARLALRHQLELMLKDATNRHGRPRWSRIPWRHFVAAQGIDPFHWELEFPEVFTADNDGKSWRL